MNLFALNRSLINMVVPDIAITLNLFNGNNINSSGIVTSSYTTFNGLLAQVQLENNQKLMHKDYFQQNKIYKRFYIANSSLTGLNRNINTAGDYILMQNLYYKIVEVKENFQVGWIMLIGCESTDKVTG
jgi:hypothetical protein